MDDQQPEDIMDKCMMSQPNKMTLEQIKKLHAYAWSFG